ncbi:PLD nuclease N-terminal domain-containing protein [Pseudomonas borbori]
MDLLYAALALVLLALHLWAAYNVLKSNTSRNMKVLWVSLILLFPLLGVFNWFIMGPRAHAMPPR